MIQNDNNGKTFDNSGKFNLIEDSPAEKEFKRVNIFQPKPKGFVIFDTFNNKFFPIDLVKIDKTEFDLKAYIQYFHKTYGGSPESNLFMPFHFCVELVGKQYYPIQLRPIYYKSKIPGFEDYISICIMGDSNVDVYPHTMYKVIAHTIMNSFHYIPGIKLDPSETTTYHNLGKQFKLDQLKKHYR